MIRREFLAGLTGLSALAAAPAISFAQTPMNLGQQWDVIVIGSGLAGLSAALSASENGARTRRPLALINRLLLSRLPEAT